MTQIETPKVVKKKLFSPIWLLPIIALVLGAWLGVKSIRESGVEVRIHFPSATGIDVGKTLVRYQGLTVGKVVDISIDDDLQGVNVDVLMDYRAAPFLNDNTQFWLVTPKASITGVEGLDALFSGNYIAIKPGDGDSRSVFEAARETPVMLPGNDGLVIELSSDTLGSLDVGSQVYYRQIPVGKVISYRLETSEKIVFNAYIQQKYADLVKVDSQFWNVSGFDIDASLNGISVKTESLAAILAGGISFSSTGNATAQTGQHFNLYESEALAYGGKEFTLIASNADQISEGSRIQFRGIEIGRVVQSNLDDTGVEFKAKIDHQYADLLTGTAKFWIEGADISFAGVKHASRLITGSIVNFMPGQGPSKDSYNLLESAPEIINAQPITLQLTASENPNIKQGAQVRYKQLPIGKVTKVAFSDDFKAVEYQVEIDAVYASLLKQNSYFLPESVFAIDASLDGVSVTTRDLDTFSQGAISLISGDSSSLLSTGSKANLYASADAAEQAMSRASQTLITLSSPDGGQLSANAPVYYKKMQIGQVNQVNWQADQDNFAIEIGIDKTFKRLIQPNTVFWRNSAMTINAGLSGVDIDVAPIEGALKGSITLSLLAEDQQANSDYLYQSQVLAEAQAVAVKLHFPASTKLSAKAAIRYQGHQVGEIEQVSLDNDLQNLTAIGYLYGDYADKFTQDDAHYTITEAKVSITGIEAPETLITGAYVSVTPGNSGTSSFEFYGEQSAPLTLNEGDVRFTLIRDTLGSLNIGTPLVYRGVKIGQIDHYQLNGAGNQIELTAHVEQPFAHLVNQSSQFWDLSGIKVDFGLFSGAQVETGSLETILAGGIGVATELVTSQSNLIATGQQFIIAPKAEEQWLQWSPVQQKP
ncbi:MCE family protein [Shewanella sp. Scap07]|uniref:MlaD family protein n=1 Tax=Shewanella sp. Scap07 TaxID=2589987 RepID=UPI0015C149A5|nr:MlaD family protein [Shewanella sp. Scap07]QLE85372.1 MCE family protein [Shewanella sp. Scap07]